MADFRKLLLVLAVLTLTVGIGSAQPVLSCVSNAGVPPLVRAEGLAELVGDVVVQCTGGSGALFNVNWQIFLNTNITSKIVNSGTSLTEATLMIGSTATGGEPCPTSPPAGTTCPGATKLNATNTFKGTRAADNSVVWLGIPFTPPGTNTNIIRITNVRANANQLGVSSTLVPSQITMYISASGSQSIPINNPQQTVAYIQPGLGTTDIRACTGAAVGSANAFVQCTAVNTNLATPDSTSSETANFGLRYIEGFANAWKVKIGIGTLGVTSSSPFFGSQTIIQDPSVPGVSYNTESGFVNSTDAAFSADGTGKADQGTRLMAVFSGIPAGVTIYVATGTNNAINAANSSSPSLAMALVTTDSTGAGGAPLAFSTTTVTPFYAQPAGYNSLGVCGSSSVITIAAVTLTGGSGVAVWEVIASNPAVTETAVFPVFVAYKANTASNLPGIGTGNVAQSFAPTSTVGTMSASAVNPRFAGSSTTRASFTVNSCSTNILFPFVTNSPGFDTGIAIANTSVDPFGTGAQSGKCVINYYGTTNGTGAAPAPQTTTSVSAGGMLTFSLFGGGTNGMAPTQGFQGYVIAQCAFQYAHAFAFISDLGGQKFAEGYLALILDGTGITSRTNPIATELLGVH